jgi:hypothetical protein
VASQRLAVGGVCRAELGESLVATGHSLTTAIIDGGDDAALFEAQLGAVGVTARLAAEAVNLVRAAGRKLLELASPFLEGGSRRGGQSDATLGLNN